MELLNEYAVLLTIMAAFSQSIVLAVTLFIFFKNLTAIRKHNKITSDRFEVQSKIEKFTLTLRFADWIKSELSDYVPYLNSDSKHAFLSSKEIENHFESIAKNTIELIKKEIIFRTLLIDEIKKLFVVTESYSKNKELILELKQLLKIEI